MEELNTGIGLNKSLKEIFDSSRVSIHKWENYFASLVSTVNHLRRTSPTIIDWGKRNFRIQASQAMLRTLYRGYEIHEYIHNRFII